jgi:pimeloyl-ACP methyl ester carboxylesterase
LLSKATDHYDARPVARARGILEGMGTWWSGLSSRRRLLVLVLACLVVMGGAAAGIASATGGRAQATPDPRRPGYVLLIPGYGGSTGSLDVLAGRIRDTGKMAIVVKLDGNGTGDLRAQAGVLQGYVDSAVKAGSGPVTIIGYSAGGVVAWLWDVTYDGAARAARIITLGSPFHGTDLAALGNTFLPGECPVACQQLVPGSSLLTGLADSSASRPPWLSLWTDDDTTVYPPTSAQLDGAVNVPLQSVCPTLRVDHSQLPDDPLVDGIILRTLTTNTITTPTASECHSLTTLGN